MASLELGGYLGVVSSLEDAVELTDPETLQLLEFRQDLAEVKTSEQLFTALSTLTLEMANKLNSPLADGLYAGYYGVAPSNSPLADPADPPEDIQAFTVILTNQGSYLETLKYLLERFPELDIEDLLVNMTDLTDTTVSFLISKLQEPMSPELFSDLLMEVSPSVRVELYSHGAAKYDKNEYFASLFETIISYLRKENCSIEVLRSLLETSVSLSAFNDVEDDDRSIVMRNILCAAFDCKVPVWNLLLELLPSSYLSSWVNDELERTDDTLIHKPEIVRLFYEKGLVSENALECYYIEAYSTPGCVEAVKLALDYGVDIGTPPSHGERTSLVTVMDQGDLPTLELLLARGVTVEFQELTDYVELLSEDTRDCVSAPAKMQLVYANLPPAEASPNNVLELYSQVTALCLRLVRESETGIYDNPIGWERQGDLKETPEERAARLAPRIHGLEECLKFLASREELPELTEEFFIKNNSTPFSDPIDPDVTPQTRVTFERLVNQTKRP